MRRGLTGVLAAIVVPLPVLPQAVQQPISDRVAPGAFATQAQRFDAVVSTFESSYITMLGGAGNIQRLVLEADIAPNFAIGFGGWSIAATPKVLLRMFNAESAPIRTPSFMPRLTWYYWAPFPNRANRLQFLSVTLSHHSNGQAGPFLEPGTTTPNTLDGSFSTNYVEVGFHQVSRTHEGESGALRLGARVHIPLNEDRELRDQAGTNQYGRYRLLLSGRNRGLIPLIPVLHLPLMTQVDYFYVVDPTYQGHGMIHWRRFGGSLTAAWLFRSPEPAGVFLNAYAGPDYYNIWYKQYLAVLRGGVIVGSVTTLRRP